MGKSTHRKAKKNMINVDYSIVFKPTKDQIKVLELLKTGTYQNIRLAESMDLLSDKSVMELINQFFDKYQIDEVIEKIYSRNTEIFKHYPFILIFHNSKLIDYFLTSSYFFSIEDYLLYIKDIKLFVNGYSYGEDNDLEQLYFGIKYNNDITYKSQTLGINNYLISHEIQQEICKITGLSPEVVSL